MISKIIDWFRGYSQEDELSVISKMLIAEPGELVPLTKREYTAIIKNPDLFKVGKKDLTGV